LNSSSRVEEIKSMAHFRFANRVISSMLDGGSCPITRARGLFTNSESILGPNTGTRASTFRMRIWRTLEEESLYVSGTMALVERVQSQTASISAGGQKESCLGRRSKISWRGSEWWVVCVLTMGRMWNRMSRGVARYIAPSTC
jgi:hypothetical protein